MDADWKIGGGWGDAIEWVSPNQFLGTITFESRFDVCGWKFPHRPRVGDTLLGEFEKSWMLFEFTDVKYEYDPPDMFFGKVKPIKQEMKNDTMSKC